MSAKFIPTNTVCVYQHCAFRAEFQITNHSGDEFIVCGLHLEPTTRLMSPGAPLKVEPIMSAWPDEAKPGRRPMLCKRCGTNPTLAYDGECEACKLYTIGLLTLEAGVELIGLEHLIYEKCAECHLFIEQNPVKAGPGIAPYIHLDRGDDADELITSTHDATSSGMRATLATWKVFGPPAMRERFIDNDSGERDA